MSTLEREVVMFGGLALAAGFITNSIYKLYDHPSPCTPKQKEHQTKTKEQQYTTHRSQMPESITKSNNSLIDELKWLESPTCEVIRVEHLANYLLQREFPQITSPLLDTQESAYRKVFGGRGFLPADSFIYRNTYTLSHCQFGPNDDLSAVKKWVAAGPRNCLYFRPKEVKACIVTCGGLCPGLNAVIREIVVSLNNSYQVNQIWGIPNGYKGFYSEQWIPLTLSLVKNIHHQGGTILGSSRGGFNQHKIIQAILSHDINQVYIIGGDGTQKGVYRLFQGLKEEKVKVGICSLPKTIDNDIPLIDKSFGFETAVQEAVKAIKSGWVESHSAEYGVGLVRLMGRNAGFIAMEACSASRDSNVCLIPEFPFELYGQRGLLQYVYQRLRIKKHIVIVVAEGADTALKDANLPNLGKDASGNVKAGDIGMFLKDEIVAYCKKQGISPTLKYIDPTYMIRSVAANYYDQEMCSQLAQSATHGLMAGFSGFSVGHVNNDLVLIPLKEITNSKYTNTVRPNDRHWQRLLASTGQPSFLNDEDNVVRGQGEQQLELYSQLQILNQDDRESIVQANKTEEQILQNNEKDLLKDQIQENNDQTNNTHNKQDEQKEQKQ